MADYTQITDFSAKDSLSSGDPEKLILGSDVDGEFSAIASAISSKYDSTDLASQAQAEAETANTVLMTPLRVAQWADANGGLAGDIQALSAPGADSILGYDLSEAAAISFSIGTGLTTSTTTILLDTGSALNVDHSAITFSAGTGLSGGGTLAANRSFALSHLGIESLTDPNDDRIMFWDDGAGAMAWLTASTGLTLSGTNLSVDASSISHDGLSGFVSDEHVAHSGVTLTAGTGLSGGGTIAASRSFALDIDSLTNNIGATGAVDLDVDEVAIANSTATEKVHAAALITPEVPSIVTGTTDTLAETDFGKTIRYNNAAITVTLPDSLKTGFWCVLLYIGSGSLTLSATTTLNTASSLTSCDTQYGAVTVFHAGSNVWYAWGQLDS